MFVVFFLLWVVFNGKLNVEIAIFGVILSAAVYLFSEQLVWVGGSMLGALVLTAVLWLVHKIRKLAA